MSARGDRNGAAPPAGEAEPEPHLEGEVPDEVKMAFAAIVQRVERRRRITLAGYALAVLVLVLGTLGSLAYVGSGPRGAFRMWIFMLPVALVGAILWGFGRWSRKA